MSSSKEKACKTAVPGTRFLRLNTAHDNRAKIVSARVRVRIHTTQAPQNNGALVLRSAEGDNKSDCTYWKKRPVSEATAGEKPRVYTLDFTPKQNEGTGRRALGDCRYTLGWRPKEGSPAPEVLLFEDRAAAAKSPVRTTSSLPAPLALVGGLLARPDQGRVTITDSGVKGTGGSVAFTKSQVEGLEHKAAGVGRQWQLDKQRTSLTSGFSEAARTVGLTPTGVKGTGAVLDAVNVAVSGATLMWNFEQGTLQPKDGLAAAKCLADSAGLAEMAAEAGTSELPTGVRSAAKVLAKAGPVLDTVTIAWNVASALSDNREEGLQQVDDPSYVGAVGAVASGVGTMALTGALAGTAGLPVLAGAGALTLLGAGLSWSEKWENVEEHIESDPLVEKEVAGVKMENYDPSKHSRSDIKRYSNETVWTGWLPEESQWGTQYSGSTAARKELLKLATPKKGQSASPPVKPVKDETEQFVQKAFTFPTAVGVPPKPDTPSAPSRESKPPLGVFLSIIPKYVPKDRGTFMVDTKVELLNDRGQPVGEEQPLQCSVHYVQTEDGLRYCARSASGDPLAISSGQTLKDLAEAQKWAYAEPGSTPVPGGEVKQKIHLPVHVGPVWKETWYSGAKQEEARSDVKNMEQLFQHRWDEDPPHWAEEEVKQAIEVGESVEPTSQIDASSELLSILQSGQFEVSGYVYFNPLSPFQPNPSIPSGPPAETNRMLSGAEIDYVYRY